MEVLMLQWWATVTSVCTLVLLSTRAANCSPFHLYVNTAPSGLPGTQSQSQQSTRVQQSKMLWVELVPRRWYTATQTENYEEYAHVNAIYEKDRAKNFKSKANLNLVSDGRWFREKLNDHHDRGFRINYDSYYIRKLVESWLLESHVER